MTRTFAWLSTAALCAFVAPAFAQAPDAASAPDEETIVITGTYTLQNKIDTATGLGLTTLETPQSVSIMTAQRILDQNLITVKDVITNAVGVSANEFDDVRNSFFARIAHT